MDRVMIWVSPYPLFANMVWDNNTKWDPLATLLIKKSRMVLVLRLHALI